MKVTSVCFGILLIACCAGAQPGSDTLRVGGSPLGGTGVVVIDTAGKRKSSVDTVQNGHLRPAHIPKRFWRGDSLWSPNPRKAARWAILPGAGQVYNRAWWKVPITWAAVGTPVGFAIFNHRQYTLYNNAYRAVLSNDSITTAVVNGTELSQNSLQTERDAYRRNRDLMFILTSIGYALTIIEAYVDAHLAGFDVSPNLSLHIQPRLLPVNIAGQARVGAGMHLGLRFRR